MPKLAHVCIEAADLERTEKFYQVIGMTRQFEFRNKKSELVGMYLAFDDNTFIEVIKVKKPREEGAVRHFAIEVEDVDAMSAKLTAQDIAVTPKMLGSDKTLMVTTHDPNGIFVEFHQYTGDSMQQHGGVAIVDYEPV